MNEQILRRIWLGGGWPRGSLRDGHGRHIEVVFPGRSGHGAGPDLLDAILALPTGKLIRGDVEFHVRSSDWNRHGHSSDSRYSGVVAHVVWHDDCERPALVPNQNGLMSECALTIALALVESSIIFQRLGTAPEREQPYHAWLDGLSLAERIAFIDGLGDERLVSHATRLSSDWHGLGPAQALYRWIMDALGYSANRRGFAMLAERVPFAFAHSVAWSFPDIDKAESAVFLLLLASSGMLDDIACARIEDGPARAAAERCRDLFGMDLPRDRMQPGEWEIVGVRPANRPIRRLAAAARLIVRHRTFGFAETVIGAFAQKTPRFAVRTLLDAARVLPTRFEEPRPRVVDEPEKIDYWMSHSDFERPIGTGPIALIGEDRARAILANVLIPFGLVSSDDRRDTELADSVRRVWEIAPVASANWITNEMRHIARSLGRVGARREQGIIELYRRCCAERRCLTCPAASARATASGS